MTEAEYYKTHREFYEFMKKKFPNEVHPYKPIPAHVVRAALVLAGASEADALREAPDNASVEPAIELFYRLRRATGGA